MSRCCVVLLLSLCLGLWPLPSVRGGGPAPKPVVRTDRHGDPLPEGASTRFGSARLRVDRVVKAFAFWPDDRTLAACCADGSVRTWDRATGRERRRRHTGLASVDAAIFVPGGNTVALVEDDSRLLLWDAATGRMVWKVAVPKNASIQGLVASPDGKLLALADANKVYLYAASSGRKLLSLEGVKEYVDVLAFSPDGTHLAVVTTMTSAGLWDVRTGKKVRDLCRPDFFASWGAIAFAPDGKTAAVGGFGHVVVSDVATGKEQARLKFGHFLSGNGLLFTADGKTVITGHSGVVRFWDLRTGKERFHRDTHWHQWAWPLLSHDSKLLAVGPQYDKSKIIYLLDPATGKDVVPAPDGHRFAVSLVAFSPNNRTVISGDEESVRSWDAATGKPGQRRNKSFHTRCALSPDRRFLVVPWGAGVDLWDLTRGQMARELKYKGKDVIRAAVRAPYGKSLLSLHNKCITGEKFNGQDSLHFWDLATRKETRSFPTSTDDLYAELVITSDGRLAIAGSAKGSIQRDRTGQMITTDPRGAGQLHIWELRTGREIRTLEGHRGAIRALAVSPNGKLVVSGSADGTFRLWELASGKTVFTLPGQGAYEKAVALSPDGRLIATNCGPTRPRPEAGPSPITLWSTATGKPVHQLRGCDSAARSLAFSPNGRRLASGLENGTVLVWDVALVARAVRGTSRPRSPKEPDVLWADLANLDAARAHRAVWALIVEGDEAVRLLKGRLAPAKDVTPKRLRELLADLDADQFTVREAADRELGRLAELAEPALIEALKRRPPLEVRRRVEQRLARIQKRELGPEALRAVRWIEVLEAVGTPEARAALKRLAGGAPGARLTWEAKGSLKRLAQRPAPRP